MQIKKTIPNDCGFLWPRHPRLLAPAGLAGAYRIRAACG